MNLHEVQVGRMWNTLLNASDKLAARDRVLAKPMALHIEVSDYCNLKCPHCARELPDGLKNSGNIPMEAIEKLKPLMRRANWVGLTGNGEPFLHPRILDIVDTVLECGAAPSIISNATLWKRLGVVEKFAGKGPMLLNISIDGGTKETFEKWRVNANFDEVRDNMRSLKEAKERKGSPFPVTTFVTCLMRDNIAEVEQIVDLGAEAGVASILFQNMYPYNKSLVDEMVTDYDLCAEAIAKARRHAAKYGIRIEWLPFAFDVDVRGTAGGSRGEITAQIAEQARALPNGTGHSNGNGHGGATSYHCDYVWNRIHVTIKGDLKFCCFWTEGEAGNLATDDPVAVWNGPAWAKLRNDLASGIKPKSCEGCHNLVVRDRKGMMRGSWLELRDLAHRAK